MKIPVGRFCRFVVKIPVGLPHVYGPGRDTSSFVASWSRSRLGILKFYDFMGKTPGWDTSSFVILSSRSRLGCLKFCGLWPRCRLEYLEFCSFGVKIPIGIPQILWFRGQDPGWYTSSFEVSWSRSEFGYLDY